MVVDIDCPAGMIYQQCGEACPRICGIEQNPECVGGCVEGCFCPSEKLLRNGNCINETECAGMHTLSFICVQRNISICTTFIYSDDYCNVCQRKSPHCLANTTKYDLLMTYFY